MDGFRRVAGPRSTALRHNTRPASNTEEKTIGLRNRLSFASDALSMISELRCIFIALSQTGTKRVVTEGFFRIELGAGKRGTSPWLIAGDRRSTSPVDRRPVESPPYAVSVRTAGPRLQPTDDVGGTPWVPFPAHGGGGSAFYGSPFCRLSGGGPILGKILTSRIPRQSIFSTNIKYLFGLSGTYRLTLGS
jgi:hypothetical protein